jgi:hypothetical protein
VFQLTYKHTHTHTHLSLIHAELYQHCSFKDHSVFVYTNSHLRRVPSKEPLAQNWIRWCNVGVGSKARGNVIDPSNIKDLIISVQVDQGQRQNCKFIKFLWRWGPMQFFSPWGAPKRMCSVPSYILSPCLLCSLRVKCMLTARLAQNWLKDWLTISCISIVTGAVIDFPTVAVNTCKNHINYNESQTISSIL